MAKNLRAKIPASDTLVVFDRNAEATAKFVQEVGGGVEVANSPRGTAQDSVGFLSLQKLPLTSNDEHVPYQMI